MERLPEELWLEVARLLSGRDLARGAQALPALRPVCRLLMLRLQERHDVPLLSAGGCALTVLQISIRLEPLTAVMLGISRICRNLRELTVTSSSPLSAAQMSPLKLLPHLRHLDVFIASGAWNNDFLPHAVKLHTLVVNDRVSRGFLPALAGGGLREYHMMGRSMGYLPKDLRTLLDARRECMTGLTLRCNEMNDVMYDAIAACHNLTELKLYTCHFLREGSAMRMAALQRLRVLHLTGATMLWCNVLAKFLLALESSLTDLNLSATSFTDDHVPILVQKFPQLHCLELWRNNMNSDAVIYLMENMKELAVLDTDVALSEPELVLVGRSRLSRLRCCTPAGARGDRGGGRSLRGRTLVLEARGAQGVGGRSWDGGEGPRASLYHYTDIDDMDEQEEQARQTELFDYG